MRGRSPSGAQLLETLFAFFVVSVVVLALFNLFPSSLLAIRQGNDRLQAGNLAQSLLDEQRIAPFPPSSSSPPKVKLDGVEYTPQVTVSTVSGHKPEYLRRIQVTVTWELRGRPQSLTKETCTCPISRR